MMQEGENLLCMQDRGGTSVGALMMSYKIYVT